MKINAKKQAAQGIITILHLINVGSFFSNYGDFSKKNNTIPLLSLSKKEYAPKTKAPLPPFYPITSDIKAMPVFNAIA